MAAKLTVVGEKGTPSPEREGGDPAADIEYQRLMGLSVQDILREGQKELFARLVMACRSGEASHQELAILRNILKDNGLTLGIPPEQPVTVGAEEIADLPDFEEPDDG